MEEEFIMEFDIEDDPIKKFLLHKLEEIKLNNCELREQIDNRKGLLQECLNEANKEYTQNALQVEGMWQKILNNKWIFGIKVNNTNGLGSASEINVILKWNSSNSLTYAIKIFCRYAHPQKSTSTPSSDKVTELAKLMESNNRDISKYPTDNEWIQTEEIYRDGVIVISLPIPAFVDKSKYDITGIITYQFKERARQIVLEDFDISAANLFSNLLVVKSWDVINGNDEAYLSTLIANEQSNLFVQTTPDFCVNIESVLEFECRFKKVDISSKNRKYFYVDGVNSLINGSFLVIEKESEYLYFLNVFTSNSTTRRGLLHYLKQNIPNITILPIKYKQSVQKPLSVNENSDQATTCSNSIVPKDVLKEFGKGLEEQIEFVGEFYKKNLDEIDVDLIDDDEIKLHVNNEDYQKFRNELAELELQSDLIYSQIEASTPKVEILSQTE